LSTCAILPLPPFDPLYPSVSLTKLLFSDAKTKSDTGGLFLRRKPSVPDNGFLLWACQE